MRLERFITYIEQERRYAANTVAAYRRDIEQFIDHIGVEKSHFNPELVTSDDIREWITQMSKKEMSPATINRAISSLRALFRYERSIEEVTHDPFKNVRFQKIPKKLPAYIDESKMAKILKTENKEKITNKERYIESRNQIIVLMFYSSGLRLEELREIKIEDFHENFRELKVRGKGGKQRVVPIVGYTSQKIKTFISDFSSPEICFWPQNHLFLTDKGAQISRSELYKAVKELLQEAGVQGKRSPHVLRHTFATHMMNRGADIREIQELLGHSSIATTEIYTHNSIAELKKIYKTAHPRGVKVDKDKEEED